MYWQLTTASTRSFSPRGTHRIDSLQHTATHCNTLQRTATDCSTLQHTATHCSTLQRTATHCNTLQHTAAHCDTLQHTATHRNTLQHTATHCNTRATASMRSFPCRRYPLNLLDLITAELIFLLILIFWSVYKMAFSTWRYIISIVNAPLNLLDWITAELIL